MDIQITEDENLIVLKVSGSANSNDMKKLIDAIDSLCNDRNKDVDVDLSEMEYMDSTCISLLLKLNKFQKQKGKNFIISKASYKVSSLLSLCSLSDTLQS